MHIYYIYVCAYSISMINPPEVSHSRLVLCCDRVQSLAADATWLTGGASPTSKTSLKSESLTWTGGLKGSIPGWSAIGSWCGEAWNERSSWGEMGRKWGKYRNSSNINLRRSLEISNFQSVWRVFGRNTLPLQLLMLESDNSNLEAVHSIPSFHWDHTYIIITHLKYTSKGSTFSTT